MRHSLSRFVAGQHGLVIPDPDLLELLECVSVACKSIATRAGRGTLGDHFPWDAGTELHERRPMLLDVLVDDIFVGCCEKSGSLCGVVSQAMTEPYRIPDWCRRGPYLLLFDSLQGSSNVDIGMTAGTIFSIFPAPENRSDPTTEDFLQPGVRQIAAGYALYGPASMLVITMGAGVHGFTLDRDSGAFVLTHPSLRIPEAARELAVDASYRRFWEPPVSQYIEECMEGKAGPRGTDFDMRWTASLIAEVHRILIRGGILIHPGDSRNPSRPGHLRLMYEANPIAMLVEQAGGVATTGRKRILELEPSILHQQVPAFLGSSLEVQRLVRYHEAFDRGEDLTFETPLFHSRSLFRSA